MILYFKDPKDSTKKIPVWLLSNTFGNIAIYKINIQKSVVFLYNNNEEAEKETGETISFTIY
jgi:hypothetical protein